MLEGWKRWLRLVAFAVLLVLVYFLVPVGHRLERSDVVRLLISLLVIAALTVIVFWQVVLQLERPDRRIDGLLLALLVSVLGFALGFYSLEQHDPGQIEGLHTRVDALYFTLSTLLTVGYGDVHAVGQAARALVVVQMVFNVAVIATAASALTSRVRRVAASRAESRATREPSATGHRRHGRRTHRNPT